MNKEHVISDELFSQAQYAFSQHHHWIAYNTISYFLEKADMYFFRKKDEALEFSDNNISEYDDFRIIYAGSMDELLKQIIYGENFEHQLFNSTNLSIMNEKNLDYLSKQLKFTGFGEGHTEALKEKMEKQVPDFILFHQAEFGKDSTVATLQFKKSEESDMYFFNRYSLMLKNEKNPDTTKQTFYVGNNQDNISLKEAYNLMSGRAVHKELSNKEGEKYNAWVQLDFKDTDPTGNFKMRQFHQNYGYDLAKVLSTHPIKELTDPQQKENLMQSLERGNRQSVTLEMNGKEQKVFIEASPQFKSLNFYDVNMKRVNSQKLYEGSKQEQGVKQDGNKQSQKAGDEEEPGGMKQRNAKKKGQKIS